MNFRKTLGFFNTRGQRVLIGVGLVMVFRFAQKEFSVRRIA